MTANYEIWTQSYDTFGQGDWQLRWSVKDAELARYLVDEVNSGWGTRAELRGGPPVVEHYDMPLAEFNEQYIVHYDRVYRRDSEAGKRLVDDENKRRLAEVPVVDKPKRKLP